METDTPVNRMAGISDASLFQNMEGYNKNRDFFETKIMPRPIKMIASIKEKNSLERSITLYRNHIAYSTISSHHHHQYSMKIFLQLRRFRELTAPKESTPIYLKTGEIQEHHNLPQNNCYLSKQISNPNMSRYADRAVSKRNFSLNLEPIVIDAFDNSDLFAAYDLTLVGRVLNTDLQAHRVRALISLMPQAWQLEGRIQGGEVGRGKFISVSTQKRNSRQC